MGRLLVVPRDLHVGGPLAKPGVAWARWMRWRPTVTLSSN